MITHFGIYIIFRNNPRNHRRAHCLRLIGSSAYAPVGERREGHGTIKKINKSTDYNRKGSEVDAHYTIYGVENH